MSVEIFEDSAGDTLLVSLPNGYKHAHFTLDDISLLKISAISTGLGEENFLNVQFVTGDAGGKSN